MKLSEWAHVAEITSAIAVVVSLIYIGLEVSQNTVAVKANTHQSMVDYGREQSEILLTNETLADLVEKGERNPETLTAREAGGGTHRILGSIVPRAVFCQRNHHVHAARCPTRC